MSDIDSVRADSYKSAFEKQKLELAEKDREILSITYELEDAFIDLAKRDELLEEAYKLMNDLFTETSKQQWSDRYAQLKGGK